MRLIEADSFHVLSGKTFQVNQSMRCDVKNVIHVLQCNYCKLEYIGETGNLRNRVTVHNQHIRDENLRHLKVSEHLAMCAGHMDPKYHIFHITETSPFSFGNFRKLSLYSCFMPI